MVYKRAASVPFNYSYILAFNKIKSITVPRITGYPCTIYDSIL